MEWNCPLRWFSRITDRIITRDQGMAAVRPLNLVYSFLYLWTAFIIKSQEDGKYKAVLHLIIVLALRQKVIKEILEASTVGANGKAANSGWGMAQ